jgi:formylglycine-generating enzyme required for sulfatase activity
VNEQIRKIQEHIYARYVDPGDHGNLDEDAAIRVLEEHYSKPERAGDPECCYLGILYFEHGFGDETRQLDYFRKAKFWLERSKALSHEAWDAVDDRLADIDDWFESQGIQVESALPPAPGAAGAHAGGLAAEIDDHGPMVLVPGGSFLFGTQRVSRALPAFYIDKYPVTNRQYEAFCRATGYRWPKYYTDPRFNGPDIPVVGISAADALKYCRWVGKDLPTEEQWEKAARGTDGRAYPWGEDEPKNGIGCFGQDPESGSPCPVSAHPATRSPSGAVDLAGNVWEWTSTTVEEGEALQVVKGGCFSDPPHLIRADVRLEAGPKDKFENIGFRCVKSV